MPTRILSFVHWANAGFTVGTITLTDDLLLKIAAFAFVSLPLGIIQWWNLVDRYRERRLKNAEKK